jgi:hypothetical protein
MRSTGTDIDDSPPFSLAERSIDDAVSKAWKEVEKCSDSIAKISKKIEDIVCRPGFTGHEAEYKAMVELWDQEKERLKDAREYHVRLTQPASYWEPGPGWRYRSSCRLINRLQFLLNSKA